MKEPVPKTFTPLPPDDRRVAAERRQRHWYGLWVGHSMRRRQTPRRGSEHHLAVVDWHHPQWLLVALLIILLSITDALLTLTLLARGATEINPFMAPLVEGSGQGFAYWKLGLTISGVLVLTALSRLRLFGSIRVGSVLYLLLGLYVVLVAYECYLLTRPGFN